MHVVLVVLFVLDVRVLVAIVVGEDLSNGGCRCGRGRPWKCLGRTPRLSTPMLAEALKERLLLFRCDVAKKGTLETVVGVLAQHAEADGGRVDLVERGVGGLGEIIEVRCWSCL